MLEIGGLVLVVGCWNFARRIIQAVGEFSTPSQKFPEMSYYVGQVIKLNEYIEDR